MMAFEILPLRNLSSFGVSKLFLNFNGLQLQKLKCNGEGNWELRLADCRDEAIRNLKMFIRNGNLPSLLQRDLIGDIVSLHKAYIELFLWKKTYDPDDKINLLEEGEFYAPCFFNASGKFNDRMWAKHFVINANCHILNRFSLACSYSFDDECKHIWSEIKNIYGAHFADIFENYFDQNLSLVSYKISQLEHKLKTSNQEIMDELNVGKSLFEIAVERGYQYAVYDIWGKMSESEKLNIVQNDRFFELMNCSTDFPNNHISNFLFSALSEQRKSDLLEWSLTTLRTEAWYNRLYANFRDSLDSLYKDIPFDVFFGIVEILSHKIWRHRFPEYENLFVTLSLNISELMDDIIEPESNILENLVKANAVHAVEFFIGCFSLERKGEILLNNDFGGGITAINILNAEGNFYDISGYLILFLMDNHFLESDETLREDSSVLLQRFVESALFISWCEGQIFNENINIVSFSINLLKDVLACLDDICESVCKQVIRDRCLSSSSTNSSHEMELNYPLPNMQRKFKEQ